MARATEAIFIAPPSQRPLLAALTDLSAAGLLAPFSWIESAASLSDPQALTDPLLVRVEEGRAHAARYKDVVNRHGLALVRVLVVVPLGHPAGDALTPETELHYLNLQVAHGTRRQPVRILVPWSNQPLPAHVGHAGWTNVMLAPELSADPAYPGTVWWHHPEQMPGAAAVGLAAQAGIAGSVEVAATDAVSTASGSSVSVVRTFIRHVDAAAPEQALRAQVLGIAEAMPQPVRADTSASHIAPFHDPVSRILAVAQTWYQRHALTLRRTPVSMPEVAGEQVGAWAALKMFFSFLFKAVLGAPGSWLRAQVRGVKATIAGSVGDLVFGQGSDISVVVGGVDAAGHTAAWRDLTHAARNAAATMPTDIPQVGAPRQTSFAAMWQELVEGAEGLADGSGCAALGLNRNEGYVHKREAIAPPLDKGGAYVFPVGVGPFPAGTTLYSWDQMEVNRVLGELAAIAHSGHGGSDAAQVWAQIQRWQQAGSQGFLQIIGGFLTYRFQETQNEIRQYHARLAELLSQDVTSEMDQCQRRLALILRILLIALVVVIGVVIAVKVLGLGAMTWGIVAIVSAVALVLWAVSSVITFVVQQRELFRLLHMMRARDNEIPVLAANLRMAMEDLADEGEAYAQFDQWARVLTAFLTNPLGDRALAKEARTDHVVVPQAFQNVQARATDTALADTAARLRTRIFQVGWLKAAWDHLFRSIEQDLTADQKARLMSRDLQIFAEPAAPGSALVTWAAGLQERGVRSQAADLAWGACLTYLTEDWAARSLDLRVVTGREDRPLTDYREDLVQPRQVTVPVEVFAPGRHAGAEPFTTPDAHWFREQADGMSTTMVLTDATVPLTSDFFVYPAVAREQVRFDAGTIQY